MSNVLVVDDSATMRRILSRSLVSCGVAETFIATATNGREALEVFERRPPELLLCDVAMPVLTGVELMRDLHTRGLSRDCHIVFVTSLATDAICDELLSLGAHAVLPKPFNPTQLRRTIEPYLGRVVAQSEAPDLPPLAPNGAQQGPDRTREQVALPQALPAADPPPVGGAEQVETPEARVADCDRPTVLTGAATPAAHASGDDSIWIPAYSAAAAVNGAAPNEMQSQALWLASAVADSLLELCSEMVFVDAIEVQQHPPNDHVMFIGEVDVGPASRDRLRIAATRDTAGFASRAMLGVDGEPSDIARCDTMQEIANIVGGAIIQRHDRLGTNSDWTLGIARSSVAAPGQHVMYGARAFGWDGGAHLFVSYVLGAR